MSYYGLDKKFEENELFVKALSNVYGIGRSTSLKICAKIGIGLNAKVKDLSDDIFRQAVREVLNSNILIGSELVRINRLKKRNELKIKSYKGLRKKFKLPVNGQKTKTNAKTARKLN